MNATTFIDNWRKNVAKSKADEGKNQVENNHDEIQAIIDSVVADVAKVLGSEDAVSVQPWFSTNEGRGRKIVFRMQDGYEVCVITLSIPFAGYPVTIRVGEVVRQVERGRFEDELKEALMQPSVLHLARQVQESWAGARGPA